MLWVQHRFSLPKINILWAQHLFSLPEVASCRRNIYFRYPKHHDVKNIYFRYQNQHVVGATFICVTRSNKLGQHLFSLPSTTCCRPNIYFRYQNNMLWVLHLFSLPKSTCCGPNIYFRYPKQHLVGATFIFDTQNNMM